MVEAVIALIMSLFPSPTIEDVYSVPEFHELQPDEQALVIQAVITGDTPIVPVPTCF